MSWHKPLKRRRGEELGLITPINRRIGDAAPGPSPRGDLFELLADRATIKAEREEEVRSLLRAQERQRQELEDAKLEIARLQSDVERARLRAAAREEEQAQHIAVLEGRLEEEARAGARAKVELATAQRRGEAEQADQAEQRQEVEDLLEELAAVKAELAEQELMVESETSMRAQLKEEAAAERRALRAALDDAEARVRGETDASRLLQEQLESAHSELAQAQAELDKERVRNVELESALAVGGAASSSKTDQECKESADAVVVRALRERLAAAEVAAAQVTQLREAAKSIPLLRERALSAEEQTERLKALLASTDERAAEGLAAQERLARWSAVLAEVADALEGDDDEGMVNDDKGGKDEQDELAGPERAIGLLQRQQNELLALGARVREESAAAEAARASTTAAESRLATLRVEAAALARQVEESAATAARHDRRIALLLRERDGLRAVLASYDAEYAQFNGGSSTGEGEEQQHKDGDAKQKRIAELEETVERLHAHVAQLESEKAECSQDTAPSAIKNLTAELESATARAAEAEALVRRLEAESEAMANLVDSLQMRVGRGEYNPATTRVLRLKRSPASEAEEAARDERVRELESQNTALAAAVSRLEAELGNVGLQSSNGTETAGPDSNEQQEQEASQRGEGHILGAAVVVLPEEMTTMAPQPDRSTVVATPSSTTGLAVRAAELEGEVTLLRRRTAELQKASDRLQQVFRRQITTFREAVYLLFGYRVEMEAEPRGGVRARLTLRPQNEEESAALRFDLLRAGGVALVPTELSSGRLAREVETFIDRFRSVPAFTANLTLENFQRQTQS